MRAILSLRMAVSKSTRRIRLRNCCSRNHSFTHTNAASSSFTVIISVVCSTNHSQIRSGMARRYTLTPPMIISSNPPEANWFWLPKTCFRNSNIFLESNACANFCRRSSITDCPARKTREPHRRAFGRSHEPIQTCGSLTAEGQHRMSRTGTLRHSTPINLLCATPRLRAKLR